MLYTSQLIAATPEDLPLPGHVREDADKVQNEAERVWASWCPTVTGSLSFIDQAYWKLRLPARLLPVALGGA